MGNFVITWPVKIAAWVIAAVLVILNLKMLTNEATGIFMGEALLPKIGLSFLGFLFLALLGYIVFFPLFDKLKKTGSIQMHSDMNEIRNLIVPEFKKIAVALDFSKNDQQLLAFAMGQGKENTRYVLLHVVESASARLLGQYSDDFETRNDKERMDWYVSQLQQRGLDVEGYLGFKNRSKEIVRIVKESNADMLIVGAHGHTGFKDFIYGETVDTVRHELKIPVLIVNVYL